MGLALAMNVPFPAKSVEHLAQRQRLHYGPFATAVESDRVR
jgi:hypothetical protein